MPNLPDTRSMLPSAARAALTAYLLERLEASPLNSYADPTYTYATALGEMDPDVDGYAWRALDGCWQEAKAEYDRRHPKTPNGPFGYPGRLGKDSIPDCLPPQVSPEQQCSCERLGVTRTEATRCPACPKRETNG